MPFADRSAVPHCPAPGYTVPSIQSSSEASSTRWPGTKPLSHCPASTAFSSRIAASVSLYARLRAASSDDVLSMYGPDWRDGRVQPRDAS